MENCIAVWTPFKTERPSDMKREKEQRQKGTPE